MRASEGNYNGLTARSQKGAANVESGWTGATGTLDQGLTMMQVSRSLISSRVRRLIPQDFVPRGEPSNNTDAAGAGLGTLPQNDVGFCSMCFVVLAVFVEEAKTQQ